MIAEHGYTATLLEGAGHDLAVRGGRVNLDEGRYPHVSASLTIPVPDEALQELLDAREARRVRIDCLATYHPLTPAPPLSRSFNLGLRRRYLGHRPGTIELELASDEALMMDDVLVSDVPDTSAAAHQASMRAIINGFLARYGASLEPGTADAPFTVLEDSENLIRNPRVGVNTTDWSTTWTTGGLTATRQAAGGPAGAATYMFVQASASTTGGQLYLTDAAIPVAGGKKYTLSVWTNAGVALALDVLAFNAASTIVLDAADVAIAAGGGWKRTSITFTTPADAVRVRPIIKATGTLAAAAGFNVTGFRLCVNTGYAGINYATYLDGDTIDTTEYAYTWNGTAHASTSKRTALIDRSPELLNWNPGESVWDFLQPLWQSAGFRLFCDEQRRWFLVDGAAYIADGAHQFSTATNLVDADDVIARDSEEWFEAAVVTYRWIDRDGAPQERIDYYALPGATKAKTFTLERPYPGPGFAEYVVKRAQGKGRTQTVSAVSLYDVTPSQPVTITLPDTPIQTGLVRDVTFDLDRDEMSISTRGLTDTPPGSWLFGPSGLAWNELPAGMAWDEFEWS